MNKLFTPINFFILLLILVMVSIAHLMYGHCQSSKMHFMVQIHYMPKYLPNWMLIYEKDKYFFHSRDENYSGKWLEWYESGSKLLEFECKDGKRMAKE